MSVQVGAYCFATSVDAAPHACAAFVPVTQVNGSSVSTVGCSSANPDGSLAMYRVNADSGTGAQTTVAFTMALDYPPCVQSDYVDAAEALAGPVLACLVACWGLWKLTSYLGWGRADGS
jgi:hypothetical protein